MRSYHSTKNVHHGRARILSSFFFLLKILITYIKYTTYHSKAEHCSAFLLLFMEFHIPYSSCRKINNNLFERRINVKKNFSTYLWLIGFISIFLEGISPVFTAISILSIAGGYVISLYREYKATKKLDPFSVIFCVLIIGWVLLRQFVTSKQILYVGSLITYAYLIRTSYRALGNLDKQFVGIAIFGAIFGAVNLVSDSKVLVWINLAFQVLIILRCIDPILEKIALEHRAKRLAAAAEKKKAEEENQIPYSERETIEEESEIKSSNPINA